jgi:hypothetical protein
MLGLVHPCAIIAGDVANRWKPRPAVDLHSGRPQPRPIARHRWAG